MIFAKNLLANKSSSSIWDTKRDHQYVAKWRIEDHM